MKVQFLGAGHPNIRATHAKTLEIIAGDEVSTRGTCILGVGAAVPTEDLLRLRGDVVIRLESGGVSDTLTASLCPFYLGEPDIVVRQGPALRQRTFASNASKGAADVDRTLVAAVRGGEALNVSIEEVPGPVRPGALFVVALPIGNDDDISLRALKVLSAADLILAEDTRRYRRFARATSLAVNNLASHHVGNESRDVDAILARIASGGRIALVTDAGTPSVSDPGYLLIDSAVRRGHAVCAIPGASALLAAIVSSGLPTDRFQFVGFLPRRSTDRRRRLAEFNRPGLITVAFESPHRILESLADVRDVLADPVVAVCRELTKIHETIVRGRASEVIAQSEEYGLGRGEHTIVIAPNEGSGGCEDNDLLVADRMVASLRQAGLPTRVIADAFAEATGVPRRLAYERVLGRNTPDGPFVDSS